MRIRVYALAPAVGLALALAAAPALHADEGMWMPQQVPALADRLKALGFAGDPAAFSDLTGFPMGAIVSLGGCSASFVSPEGLIATNHHCVTGALQYNSTPDRNLLKDGFLAKTKDAELPNGPGSRIFVTTSFTDVTEEITGKIDPKLSDRQRFDLIERRVKERTAACEKSGLRCRVASFYEGGKYFEVGQSEIQDVRLVYAPPASIGNFGGETDNWQWPRHTGDFSFYRAYVARDGKPATYSKDNVPYVPKHWLRVSPKGASEGDVVFVAGYPGRTSRLDTWGEVKDTMEWSYPRVVRRAKEQLAILEELGKKSKETQIKVAARVRGLANGMKNREGVLEGMKKGNLLEKKQAAEKDLRLWIEADAKRKATYGPVLDEIGAMQAVKEKTRERDAVLGGLFAASNLLGSANTIYKLSLERPKKDLDREPAYQERNWSRIKEATERAERTIDLPSDRALLRYVLREAAALPAGQRLEPVDKAVSLAAGMPPADADKAIDAFLDGLYAGTKLGDKATRLALLEKSTADVLATKDSFIAFAAALEPAGRAVEEREKELAGKASRLRPLYARALVEKSGGLLAPDANGTLRVTYGVVKPVSPRDGMVYLAQTRVDGVLEKYKPGDDEFDLSPKHVDAIRKFQATRRSPFADPKLRSVPVNFLSSVDTTGGNSGSATLNAKGELVGLLFDGTYETIASDFIYDTEKTRSIQVDTRYMLWVMSEVSGATNLLQEMGVDPSVSPAPGL